MADRTVIIKKLLTTYDELVTMEHGSTIMMVLETFALGGYRKELVYQINTKKKNTGIDL